MPDPSLLILIPAYNEEARIEPVLRDYAQFFQRNYSGKFRIFVVLNGCTDDTLGVVKRVAADFPEVRALEFRSAIGKEIANGSLATTTSVSTEEMSRMLFNQYVFPFEATSILILIAILGALVLAKRDDQ